MPLIGSLAKILGGVQKVLFPWLEEEVGELTGTQKKLIRILEVVRIEDFIDRRGDRRGRPKRDRAKIARAFVAKAVCGLPTTKHLVERLRGEKGLRLICGWEAPNDVPDESTFSRAFEEFAAGALAAGVHEAMVRESLGKAIILHISRDATEIEAREKPCRKERAAAPEKTKRKKGRPKKGEPRPAEPMTRLERQRGMTPEQMLQDLPAACDTGCKRNSKGYKETWQGYKLHIDVADGQIPVSCILTSASVHDSQAALPLSRMTGDRVASLYDLMDSAYDCPVIREDSAQMGHVPIIDVNTRGDRKRRDEIAQEEARRRTIGFKAPEDVRFNSRTGVERVNARLKDEFGGRNVRVRGPVKVMAHLMFGILALTADQLIRLVS
jgi:hypothetical protein